MSFSWGSLTSQTPNIQKLASKKDVDGLIKALDYRDHKTPTRGTMIVEAAATALGDLRAGDRVNVEADVVGKFVQQLVMPHLSTLDSRPST